MFTGLVEEVGRVEKVQGDGASVRIRVSAQIVPPRLKIGDSVAVSGVCLTAVRIGKNWFEADLAQETVRRTSLSRLDAGVLVNLETPVKAGTPLGGHIVQGHVDGVGKLVSLEPVQGGNDHWLTLELPPELVRYVVEKGSITVEGISLTVAKVEANAVSIAIIPHTFEATNLHSLEPGALVNIEVDVLAKYAEKMLQSQGEEVRLETLMEQGF
jgi:riboflavin synthase